MNPQPLDGMRVLDLTTMVVGPACTLRLAQYGAAVIKVEIASGDVMRAMGGPSPTGQHGGSYLHLNRGKHNLCLDLKRPEARAALLRVLDGCDALVSNMRPDALARLGLDAATLRAVRPDLVHCIITGFGPDGPYRGQPAYDSVIQGASGLAGLFLARDGRPAYVPMLIADHVTGEIAAGAVLAALLARARGAGGSAVEVPMQETMAAFVLQQHLGPQSFDPPIGPAGDRRTLDPSARPLRTQDGWISIAANTDAQVRAFARVTGQEFLLQDSRFATVASRMHNVAAWNEARGASLPTRPTADWVRLLHAADVPAMPCHSLETLLADPHLAAVGLVSADTHPTEGRVAAIRPSVLQNGAAAPPGFAARPIGWDTRAVLEGAGLAPAEIAALLASGAAFDGQMPTGETT